jgi:hypothetical protein
MAPTNNLRALDANLSSLGYNSLSIFDKHYLQNPSSSGNLSYRVPLLFNISSIITGWRFK